MQEVAAKQIDAGVDIISDGEMSKISYVTYMRHRFTGFEIADVPRATPQDLDDYPAYKQRLAEAGGTPKYHRPVVRDAIRIKDLREQLVSRAMTNGQQVRPNFLALFAQPVTDQTFAFGHRCPAGWVSGAIAGVLMFTIISYGMTFMGMDQNFQYILKGIIIVAAVALDTKKYLKKS